MKGLGSKLNCKSTLDENGIEQVDFEKMEKYFGKEQTENVKAIEQSSIQAEQLIKLVTYP